MTSHLSRFASKTRISAAGIFTAGLFSVSLVVASLVSGQVFAQTSGKSRASGPSPITIEATESLEWNQTDGTYVAKGSAFVQQDQASIRAEQIIARYTTEGKTRDITRVIATGAVTYIEGENVAKGDKLNYDLTSSLYVLTGEKTSVESPSGLMTAKESITYDTNDNAPNDASRKVVAIGMARYENRDGRTIFGDKLIAHITNDGTLQTINAYGNTKVVTVDGTRATADKLTYFSNTSIANLDGNVQIIDKENVMRGAKAKIDFEREISKILAIPGGKRVSGTLTP